MRKNEPTGWKVLKQPINVSSFWVCASFPYTKKLELIAINKLGKLCFHGTFLVKIYAYYVIKEFQIFKTIFLKLILDSSLKRFSLNK